MDSVLTRFGLDLLKGWLLNAPSNLAEVLGTISLMMRLKYRIVGSWALTALRLIFLEACLTADEFIHYFRNTGITSSLSFHTQFCFMALIRHLRYELIIPTPDK